MRARDLGLVLAGRPGVLNAVTDVAGLQAGMVTLIEDTESPGLAIRTGVTAVLPAHAGHAIDGAGVGRSPRAPPVVASA